MGRMCLLTLSTEVFFRRRSIFWRKIVGTLGGGDEERWREERWREEKWREEDVMGGEMEGRHKFERFCYP